MMDFPVTINEIKLGNESVFKDGFYKENIGKFVSIRPCGEEYGGKTYLGILLGEAAMGLTGRLQEGGILEINFGWHNPAIFIPDLKKIIMGAESWWGIIESLDQLRQITDEDIQGVWYMQALKAIEAEEEGRSR